MFYEVPNEMNDLAVRVHNNNIPGVMTIPQNVGPNMKTYIYCCSVCHPLTLHTCKANQQTHGPTALSPGGIEKLLKLWNNIVNWKKLDQLPSFL